MGQTVSADNLYAACSTSAAENKAVGNRNYGSAGIAGTGNNLGTVTDHRRLGSKRSGAAVIRRQAAPDNLGTAG